MPRKALRNKITKGPSVQVSKCRLTDGQEPVLPVPVITGPEEVQVATVVAQAGVCDVPTAREPKEGAA